MPKTSLGKWSAGLNAFFVTAIVASIILVKALNILDFGDRWWDVTVAVAFPASLIGFVIGIMAISRSKERSVAVFLSVIVGFCTVLFIPLHSLFISD